MIDDPQNDNDSLEDEENVMITQDVSFDEAKLCELQNWRKNNVYVEIQDDGQKRITTRWICTLKESSNGIVHKARLVARGFEELEKQQLAKDSPTCSTESLRMLLAVFISIELGVHSF